MYTVLTAVLELSQLTSSLSSIAMASLSFAFLSSCTVFANFANQACEMTIWERYAAPLHKAGHHPHQSPSAPALAHGENAASRVAAAEDELVRCAACARTMTDCALGKQRSLRRCMYCREVLYCSAKCVRAHAKTHQALHALRQPLQNPPHQRAIRTQVRSLL